MASNQQNNYMYSSIPQQQQQQQAVPQAQAAAAAAAVGGASSVAMMMAPTAPGNASAPEATNPRYAYSPENIQQAVAATAALMETNGGNFRGVETAAIQQSVRPGGVRVPPTAAAVPEIPAQFMAIGASVPAPVPAPASAPALLATKPNEQLMALMATAAMQQIEAQQQLNPTIVATTADQQQGFGLADQGSVPAAGVGNVMAPEIPQQMQQVQYERGSQVMEGTTATIEDTEAPAPAAVVGGQQPTYVNAKQYKRILKRREERALIEEIYSIKRQRSEKQKAASNGRGEIGSSSGKGYHHESRHRHAKKRPRDKTGRFLTKAELVEYYKEHPEEDPKRLKGDSGMPMTQK